MKKIRIGIDMRMAGEGFGIGKYIVELVNALLARKPEDIEYVLFFDQSFSRGMYERFAVRHPHCRLIDAPYYSLSEQVKLPLLLLRERLDLVHFPNFNAPVLYPKQHLITIHDLIHHRFTGKKKRNFIYRLGYRVIIWMSAHHASRVISVSEFSKSDIINLLGVAPERVDVVYEGVAPVFAAPVAPDSIQKIKTKYGIGKRYLIAVGEWRRYKNLPFLAAAFAPVFAQHPDVQLVLVGSEDKNYPEVRQQVFSRAAAGSVVATGKVPAEDLYALYHGATGFVTPSLIEGFGLPALEAQAAGLPVASSDIPVAREVLGTSAVFFDPADEAACTRVLERLVSDDAYRAELAARALLHARDFTWANAAERTEGIYRKILHTH